MKNEKLEDGYSTSDINLASAMLCHPGVQLVGIGGEGKEKVFNIKGDPELLAKMKSNWFNGIPVTGDLKAFADKKRGILAVLPR